MASTAHSTGNGALLFQQQQQNQNVYTSGSTKKTTNLMLMELLEKYFNQNPWYDMTNLDELIKLTGLDEHSIKVNNIIKNIDKVYFLFKTFYFFSLCSVTLKRNE